MRKPIPKVCTVLSVHTKSNFALPFPSYPCGGVPTPGVRYSNETEPRVISPLWHSDLISDPYHSNKSIFRYRTNFNFCPLRDGTKVISKVDLLAFSYRTIRGQCRWRSARRGSLSGQKLKSIRYSLTCCALKCSWKVLLLPSGFRFSRKWKF